MQHITPHDAYFRAAMNNPKVAREFFEQHLPANIKAAMDLTALQIQKESFIDDKLKLQITDLIFATKFNQRPATFICL